MDYTQDPILKKEINEIRLWKDMKEICRIGKLIKIRNGRLEF